jgi:predicted AAA+ superfamily ATPase
VIYQPRFLETKIRGLLGTFGAILVTGPRQAGKTSLLAHLVDQLFPGGRQISFDTPSEIDAFRRDPELFFTNNPGFVFLDEVQHVPDIFPYLKRELDRSRGAFRFFLSGSQHFELMKGVTESLAGRASVLDLWPFAVQEGRGRSASGAAATVELLQHPERLQELVGADYSCNDSADVVPAMLAGGYPPVVLQGAAGDWLEAYRRTYLQRDIRQLSQVGDLGLFDRFLTLCAGRTGTVLNKTEISRILGVDHKTADHWLSLLETSYQIVSLPAYHPAATKRLVRRPKWIFADIGLTLHLQGIRDAPGLLRAPHFGSLFESFVIMELRKLYGHLGMAWDGYFWRTATGLECDLVLATEGRLIPIEVKHAATITDRSLLALDAFLDDNAKTATCGILLSMNPRVERLSRRVFNVPLGLILNGLNKN